MKYLKKYNESTVLAKTDVERVFELNLEGIPDFDVIDFDIEQYAITSTTQYTNYCYSIIITEDFSNNTKLSPMFRDLNIAYCSNDTTTSQILNVLITMITNINKPILDKLAKKYDFNIRIDIDVDIDMMSEVDFTKATVSLDIVINNISNFK